MAEKKSKHAFGSEANVDAALANGLIDVYDILFLSEGKIGWIDKNGNKVILEDKEQVALVSELPETGTRDVLYIYDNKVHLWDGSGFITSGGSGGMSEDDINQKIDSAKDEVLNAAKAYADEQVATASSSAIIEF